MTLQLTFVLIAVFASVAFGVGAIEGKAGKPLKVLENGKPVKYSIIAKAGYTAPREVE